MLHSIKKGFEQAKVIASSIKAKAVEYKNGALTALGLTLVGLAPESSFAAAIPAPDMADATTSVTNVFGAVLGVAVLVFGFKKVKSLL